MILPEIFLEFLMKKECIDYKEAARDLYEGALPAVHHTNMLLADSVMIALSLEGRENGHITDCRRRFV